MIFIKRKVELTIMSSTYEHGYIEYNPYLNNSYDKEHDEEIYVPSEYPLSIPRVYLEGSCETYYPQIAFGWSDDTIVVARDNFLIKYTKHCYCELLAEDENGNVIWVDGRTAPYSGCWKGKYLNEVRGALSYDIEEFHFDTFEKKTYKVTLDSTSPITVNDLTNLVDYIDPNLIKKINNNKDDIPTPSN